jgi:hypothetical protein
VVSHQGLHPGQWQGTRQVVGVGHPHRHRDAGLFRTAVALAPQRRSREDQARLQLAWLWRDAKPLADVRAGPARATAQRALPCPARLRAVPFATRAARQHTGHGVQAFSLARRLRRAFTHPWIDRIGEH